MERLTISRDNKMQLMWRVVLGYFTKWRQKTTTYSVSRLLNTQLFSTTITSVAAFCEQSARDDREREDCRKRCRGKHARRERIRVVPANEKTRERIRHISVDWSLLGDRPVPCVSRHFPHVRVEPLSERVAAETFPEIRVSGSGHGLRSFLCGLLRVDDAIRSLPACLRS